MIADKDSIIASICDTLDAFIDRFLESDEYAKGKLSVRYACDAFVVLYGKLPNEYAKALKAHVDKRLDAAEAAEVLATMQHRLASGEMYPVDCGAQSASSADADWKAEINRLYASQHANMTANEMARVSARQQGFNLFDKPPNFWK